jgi:tRNA(adenine34) deaminase
MNEIYMKLALKEAKKAYKKGDVPVGAVVVENGKVIGKGYNKKEISNIATKHAEIIAIENACKNKKNWYLNNCELYVTLEPCIMCCGAIIQSRIKKVMYATESEKFGGVESITNVFNIEKNNHSVIVEKGLCKKESVELLKEFFKDKRGV